MNNEDKIKLLEQEIVRLQNELNETKEHLKKYTKSQKVYYEKNKEIVISKAKEGLKRLKETNPDKLKEYRRRAYLNRKEKLQKMKESNLENENI